MAKSKSLQTATPKPKIKRRVKAKKDLIPAPKDEVLDEDEVFKIFFTKHVQDFIAILNPPLHEAVDWSVEPHFCEQELINFLRGRLRQPDKRKVADKLLKLKLKDGNDIFVFVHNEFQNALKDELAHRWFRSRVLIYLRYNVEDITTLIIFTGDAPKKKHSFYDHTCFGTRTTFKTNAFVVVNQNVKQLIARNSPASYAFLAAKYAVMSKHDMEKRYRLKKKVVDLIEKNGFEDDIQESLLTFVFDYMLLPDDMEKELKSVTPIFQPLKSKEMELSKNGLMIRDAFSLKRTGMLYDEYVLFQEEVASAAKEAIKEKNIQVIQALLKDGFTIEKIADILKIEVKYAHELAKIEI